LLAQIKNILEVKELRDRIVYTLLIFAVYRLGTHISVPGIDAQATVDGKYPSIQDI